ncbi:MAG: flagellar protein FlaG [Thermoanaerobacterales bacterium]|nr:flagellar protein FlaG [Thermoanaerobacterales bacterium]
MSAAIGEVRRIEAARTVETLPHPPEGRSPGQRPVGGNNQQLPGHPGSASANEELSPALEKLAKTAPVFDCRFHFRIHEATKRVMVQVIDQETGEVLNEIPPEKILDLVAQIQELVGLLVDKKV